MNQSFDSIPFPCQYRVNVKPNRSSKGSQICSDSRQIVPIVIVKGILTTEQNVTWFDECDSWAKH